MGGQFGRVSGVPLPLPPLSLSLPLPSPSRFYHRFLVSGQRGHIGHRRRSGSNLRQPLPVRLIHAVNRGFQRGREHSLESATLQKSKEPKVPCVGYATALFSLSEAREASLVPEVRLELCVAKLTCCLRRFLSTDSMRWHSDCWWPV